MKKRLFAAFLLLMALYLTACSGNKMPEVKHNDCELWNTVPEGANPEFVEDYIYLWDLLENEYPYLSTAERITGKDADELKEKYYKWLGVVEDDPQVFYERVIKPCLDEFGGTGHLRVIDYNFYANMYTRFSQNPEATKRHSALQHNYEVITTPAAKKFYAPAFEIIDSAEEEGKSESLYNTEGNISIEYYPDSSAGYLKINKMNTYNDMDNPEYNAMITFFEKLESEGYENCIIDIRGNGGGSDSYWRSGIVYPNLTQALEYDTYELVKGDICRTYIDDFGKDRGEKCENINKIPLEKFSKLDCESYKYFYKFHNSFSLNDEQKPIFLGKFWLLVDHFCYSSSESFTIFCKETGFATIVGENTGGDGIGINPIFFCLPNSGICLRFSASNGLNADGSGNEEYGTTPDYYVTPDKDALQKCFELIGENGKK